MPYTPTPAPPRAGCALALRLLLSCLGPLLLLLSLSPHVQASSPESQMITAYIGGTVWDGTGAPAIRDATVLVRQGRILDLGPSSAIYVPPSAQRVECAGLFLMPGLIDAHVHFFQSAGLYTRPDILDLRTMRSYGSDQAAIRQNLSQTFRRYLASGVTGVVDLGGPFWNFDVRSRSVGDRAMGRPAPRVAIAGPLISTVSRPQLDLGDPPIIQAKSPEEAAAFAKAQLVQRPDLLKVWFIRGPDQSIEDATAILKAVANEAHKNKTRLAVHATELSSARAAVLAGADILAHSVDDEPIDDAFLALLREHGTLWISTLVVYEGYTEVLGQNVVMGESERNLGDPDIMSSWDELRAMAPGLVDPEVITRRIERMRARGPIMRDNLLRAQRAGIPVALGTDAGNIGTLHGPSVHRELELLVEAGFTIEQALLAATRDAALVLERRPSVGTLKTGNKADFLILDANPLDSLANLRSLRTVVLAGRPHRVSELLPQNPAEVIARQVEAYNARDIERFLELFHDDARVVRMPAHQEIALGKGAIRSIYQEVFERSPSLHCEVLERVADGGIVVDHELVTGLRGGAPLRATAVYSVRDGRIDTLWLYPAR